MRDLCSAVDNNRVMMMMMTTWILQPTVLATLILFDAVVGGNIADTMRPIIYRS